jgi:hypothetical protein
MYEHVSVPPAGTLTCSYMRSPDDGRAAIAERGNAPPHPELCGKGEKGRNPRLPPMPARIFHRSAVFDAKHSSIQRAGLRLYRCSLALGLRGFWRPLCTWLVLALLANSALLLASWAAPDPRRKPSRQIPAPG